MYENHWTTCAVEMVVAQHRRERCVELMLSLSCAPVALTFREMNNEIKQFFWRFPQVKKKWWSSQKLYLCRLLRFYSLNIHVPCSGKSKWHHRLNLLLLTHYIMCSHFIFALMHGCLRVLPERCRLHGCTTCTAVCCDDDLLWRWMRSAVWNSPDPLIWLLAGRRARWRE